MARRTDVKVDLAKMIYDYFRERRGPTTGGVYINGKEHILVDVPYVYEMLKREGIAYEIQEVSDALTQLFQEKKIQVHLYPNFPKPGCVTFVLSR